MTSNIPDEELLRYASRVSGQVIIITGGASGIGRAVVLEFAKRGAKMVIGDINTEASEELVNAIRINGGIAVWRTCNVLDYEDQRSLFEFALEEFGSIDVVIANAGVREIGKLVGSEIKLDERGLPVEPKLMTVQMNFISVIYTAQLAFYYLGKTTNENSLKTLILTASILSFATINAPLYCSSKHAVLSLMQSLKPEFERSGFRIASIHPWFTDTPIISESVRNLLYSIPLSPMYRVAGAVVLAVTDTLPGTNGAAYTIPDEREVFRIMPEQLNEGVLDLLAERVKRVNGPLYPLITIYALARCCVGGKRVKLAAWATLGYTLWKLSSRILTYSKNLSL
ncbi:hypothetical protein ACEPAG_4167 [Sanghuangporus baumii]